MSLGYTTTVGTSSSFNYAEMVLLNRPYCELERHEGRRGTHDLRRVYACADDFDTYFGVVLDDLLTFSTRDICRSGYEALTWSWEVFENGSNLRSGWRS